MKGSPSAVPPPSRSDRNGPTPEEFTALKAIVMAMVFHHARRMADLLETTEEKIIDEVRRLAIGATKADNPQNVVREIEKFMAAITTDAEFDEQSRQ